MTSIEIGNRKVGLGEPCFIIAEAGVNHNGSLETAYRLIDVAVEARADAVKFQTFKSERLVTPQTPKALYQLRATDENESQQEMLRRLELSEADHRKLSNYCTQRGIIFLSTPFDEESIDLLLRLGVPALKVSSGEITNLMFLRTVAKSRKPIILSTGMSTLEEVRTAVHTIRQFHGDLVVLHCVSQYPADPTTVNLRAMQTMAEAFNVLVGYSDHTRGLTAALVAVGLGACIIEKHFTLDRSLPGPDHQASSEPNELRELIKEIRVAESTLGHGRKEPVPSEVNTAAVARKSLIAAFDIPAGSRFTKELIVVKRPGTGLPPTMLDHLVGKKAATDISAGTILSLDMIQ